MSKKANLDDDLFEKALESVPEDEQEDFLANLEMLAADPRFEVRRDSQGRPIAFRKRRH